jgi:uncharacterized protein YkwD
LIELATALAILVVGTALVTGGILGLEAVGILGGGDESGGGGTSSYDPEAVESHFIDYLNDERRERGLQPVSEAPKLDALATDHAVYMAENGYVGHVQNGNQNIETRYREAGLLPECRLPTGENSHYLGTENVAGTHWNRDVRVEWAEGDVFHADTSEELAEYLFRSWMNSRGHRKAMLTASADEVSLGLERRDDEEVFAALEMC